MKSKKNRKYTKKKYLTKKQKSKRGGNKKARQIALQNARRKIDQHAQQRLQKQPQKKKTPSEKPSDTMSRIMSRMKKRREIRERRRRPSVVQTLEPFASQVRTRRRTTVEPNVETTVERNVEPTVEPSAISNKKRTRTMATLMQPDSENSVIRDYLKREKKNNYPVDYIDKLVKMLGKRSFFYNGIRHPITTQDIEYIRDLIDEQNRQVSNNYTAQSEQSLSKVPTPK